MSNKKTDWEIARGLADWVISLGLPCDGQHQQWNNGQLVEWNSSDDYINTYISGKYVSLKCNKDGKKVHSINIHTSSISESFCLGEDKPNLDDLKKCVEDYSENFNIRYWNKVYRNKLRFLEKESKERDAEQKALKIKNLEDKIKELKNETQY